MLTEVGRGNSTTPVILNGVTVMTLFPVNSLCAWRADEVDLMEFGSDICADVTKTIFLALPAGWCTGRSRNVPRSIAGGGGRISGQRAGNSYVVIWEKR